MDKIALLFPGQGCQYVGMGKTIYSEYSAVRHIFDEAGTALGYDVKKLCFEGSLSELNEIEHMLVAILTVSTAVYEVYKIEGGRKPLFMAGHSLGEYSALTCSGAVSLSDALRLVQQRCRLAKRMEETGTMTVVNNVTKMLVEEACRKCSSESQPVVIGCYNSPGQFVISGHRDKVADVEDYLSSYKAQITPLLSTPPFHSPLLTDAAAELKTVLEETEFRKPQYTVISNVSAQPYTDGTSIREGLYKQMVLPVYWEETLDVLEEQDIRIIFEIGPKAALSNLIELNGKRMKTVSFGQKDDRERYIKDVKTDSPCDTAFFRYRSLLNKCLTEAVCTRNRNWDTEEYTKGVIEPYEKIQLISEQLEEKQRDADKIQALAALKMLESVFVTKKIPLEEQKERFVKILNETDTYETFSDGISILSESYKL